MVLLVRFELTTSSFGGKHSIQVSYKSKTKNGEQQTFSKYFAIHKVILSHFLVNCQNYFSECMNNRPMLMRPVIPIREYTSLVSTVISPNKAATKSNSKRPINPQFKAPIIVKTSAIFCNVSISIIPFFPTSMSTNNRIILKIRRNLRFKRRYYSQNKNMETILMCIEVFFARMLDVSIGSVRTILLVKGKNVISTILAFIEILIWYMVARQTLTSDETNLAIILSYAGGYAIGTYVGGLINKYFVRGNLMAFVVTTLDNHFIIDKLKEAGYGVSTISTEDKKLILMIEFKKKFLKNLKNTIRELDENAFVVVNESLHVENGYLG